MKENRCLYCYQPLPEGVTDFHEKCSRKFFGTSIPPTLDYGNDQMQALAKEIVIRSITVTGVQPKLSLTIEKTPNDPKHSRLTIVGLWGGYILKPPTATFTNLPENEDLTMHLAEIFKIPAAAHSLIRLRSGELAYITKRFDRIKKDKLPLEDMCQLTETLTNDKYRSSMEKVGKCIEKYSTRPGLDNTVFFETVVFSFLTGNADMHLKNFSLLTTKENDIVLAPAYDLVCTKIVIPDDKEEMALTINARKRKLKRSDFDSFAKNLKIPAKAMENSYTKFTNKIKRANEWIDISFLPDGTKEKYKNIIAENAKKIGLL
ncbi:MAG: HipA domain-containing protein [Bacteroidota bacterium]|nr:HipA domain-containing protein [Bacteroidota bacterium]